MLSKKTGEKFTKVSLKTETKKIELPKICFLEASVNRAGGTGYIARNVHFIKSDRKNSARLADKVS
jgi:hypothetical protein